MRRAFTNALLVVVSVAVGLVVVDRVVLWIEPISGIYRYDADTDYVMRPNVSIRYRSPEYDILIETNSRGLRGPSPPDGDRCVVLVLGDSFAFGYGVNEAETFPRRLESLLEAQFPGRFQVVNAGHSGYDTRRELLFFKKRAESLRLGAVVVQFFINDILSNSGEFHFSPISGGALSRLPLAGLDALQTYLTEAPEKLLFKMGLNPDYREIEHFDCLRENTCEDGWAATRTLIEEFSTAATDAGAPMILFRIPATEEVVRDPLLGDYGRDRAARSLAEIAAAAAIDYVDLGMDPGLTPDAYFPIDGHLTATGNARAAAWLFDRGLARWQTLATECGGALVDDS